MRAAFANTTCYGYLITIGSGLPDASVKLNIWQAALPPFMRYARWASGQCPVWATTLAVISRQRIGIDIEKIMSQHTATELAPSIIDSDERQILQASLLPFPLALTLAFSAKESVYKAFSDRVTLPGFNSAKVTSLTATHISLHLLPAFAATMAERTVRTEWFQRDNSVITLVSAITRVPHDRSAPASILSAIPR